MAKSTEKSRKTQNLILFQPGQSGNPKGRAKGQRNYRTIYLEALKRIGAAEGYDPQEIEDAMTVKAISKALKGDFFFYKDIHDRIHGKPKERLDLGMEGKSLADLLAIAATNGLRREAGPKPARKNKK